MVINSTSLKDPDIRTRTSWIDADVAQSQIKKGKIEGNLMSLRVRAFVQLKFYSLGVFIQRNNGKVLFVGLLLLTLCCVGLKTRVFDTDIESLWVEESSRVHAENDYIREKLGATSGDTVEEIIQVQGTAGGGGVLNKRALLKHYRTMRMVTSSFIQLFNIEWKFKDICTAIPFSKFSIEFIDNIADELTPCIITSPLDCFFEGSHILDGHPRIRGGSNGPTWAFIDPMKRFQELLSHRNDISPSRYSYYEDSMNRAGIKSGYLRRPCLNPTSDNCPTTAPNYNDNNPNIDYAGILNEGCSSYAENYLHWPRGLILGGISSNSSGHLIGARALRSTIQLMNVKALYIYHKDTSKVSNLDWSLETAAEVLKAWKVKFSKIKNKQYRGQRDPELFFMDSSSYETMLTDFSEFSEVRLFFAFFLMIVYATISLIRWKDAIHSLGGVAIGGVIVSALGVASGMGICSVSGLKFNPSTTQILPFLSFALSTGNLFMMISTFNDLHEMATSLSITSEEYIGQLLKRIGISVCLTSTIIVCTLLTTSLIPIPALSTFLLQAVVLVLFNTAINIILVPSILSIDLMRRRNEALDVFCCFKGSNRDNEHDRYDSPPPGYSEPMYMETMPTSRTVTYVTHNDRQDYQLNTVNRSNNDTKRKNRTVKSFVYKVYAPLLEKKVIKFLTIALMLVGIAVSCYGCSRVELGGSFAELVAKDTDKHDFLSIKDRYFYFHEFFAVTKDDFDYPNNQQLLHDYHAAIGKVDGVLTGPKISPFWLELFRSWLMRLQKAYLEDRDKGHFASPDQHDLYPNATYEGYMGFKLVIQTGDNEYPIDKNRINTSYLVDDEGVINPTAFYNYLTMWVSNEDTAYAFSHANIRPTPKTDAAFLDDDPDLRVQRSFAIQYASSKFYVYARKTQLLDTIKEVREISDHFNDLSLPNFPSGPIFVYHEEFITLPYYFATSTAGTLLVVFTIYYLCTFDLAASLFMVVFQAIIPLHLLGIMGLMDTPLSSTPMVIIIIGIGISSVYTLHITMIFQHSIGCRNVRMKLALTYISTPTINNSLGSLLSLSMLAGAEFDFIIRYFFVLMYALIVVGTVYALLIIPVCLSLFGPRSTVRTKDGSDEIPQPSPDPSPLLQRRRRDNRHRTIGGGGTDQDPSERHPGSHQHQHRRHHQQQRYPRVPSDLSLTTITEESEEGSERSILTVRPRSFVRVETKIPTPEGRGGGAGPSRRPYVTMVKATTHLTVKIHSTLPGVVHSTRRDSSDSDSSYASL